MPYFYWITIPRSTQLASATMLCLVCQQKKTPLPSGRPSQNSGIVTMNTAPKTECRNASVCKLLQGRENLSSYHMGDCWGPKSQWQTQALLQSNAVLDKGLEVSLVDNIHVVCKDGRMIISKPLQRRAVLLFHHYLQHPVHNHLEETMKAKIYWKGTPSSIQLITKSCKSCQVNKIWRLQYRHLLPKIVITIPWKVLCVDLIGPYTLKGKDDTVIDFIALTMINPATSWFCWRKYKPIIFCLFCT